MIRKFMESDLTAVSEIWLEANLKTHDFIRREYWVGNLEEVKQAFLKAEIFVHVDDETAQTDGFIALTGSYIEGLFVKEHSRSKGVGKQLLNYAKSLRTSLKLNVYEKNVRAVRFYLREQFQIQAEKNDDNVNEKEMVMIWRL